MYFKYLVTDIFEHFPTVLDNVFLIILVVKNTKLNFTRQKNNIYIYI